MNTDIKKFRDLMRNDEEFREKLKAAVENYKGEQTQEAVFNNVLIPLGAEYGISVTFDEFKEYLDQLSEQELGSEEIVQIAGGTDKAHGLGIMECVGIGFGGGAGGGDESGGACLMVGAGWGFYYCTGKGQNDDPCCP